MPDAGARRKHQMWIAQGHLMAMTDGGTRRACLVPKLKSRIACRSGGRLAATRAHRLGQQQVGVAVVPGFPYGPEIA